MLHALYDGPHAGGRDSIGGPELRAVHTPDPTPGPFSSPNRAFGEGEVDGVGRQRNDREENGATSPVGEKVTANGPTSRVGLGDFARPL